MAGRPRPDDVQALSRLLKIVFAAMLVSVGCYWLVLEVISASLPVRVLGPEKNLLRLVAVGMVVAVLYLRFGEIDKLLAPATPTDPARRIIRLRALYIASYAISEGIALIGLTLKFLGATRLQTAPFFILAVALLILCYPRLPGGVQGRA
jgi:hypothetical protein